MFHTANLRKTTRIAATLAVALAAVGAHADNLNPIIGGGLGAVAGAVIGQSIGGREGAVIGAAVGGAAGVTIANNNQHSEPARTVVYPQPQYGNHEVERIAYVPAPVYYGRPWGEHEHEHGRSEERRFQRYDEYRHGGEHRGWDGRD